MVECPSENTIQALVTGALSGDAGARVHSHIETCAACRTLVIERARDLRAMRLPWTRALAQLLDGGAALVAGAHERSREQLERAHAELASAGMPLHAAMARRRLGELAGGADGARVVAEVDALLAAQDVRAPERFAQLYLPEVT